MKQQVENNDACDLFIVRYSTALSESLTTHAAYLNNIKVNTNNGIAYLWQNQ